MNVAIHYENIHLRSWEINDALELSIAGNHPDIEVNMNDGFPQPYTIEKALRFIESSMTSSNVLLAIVMENKVIGSIGAFFDAKDVTTATIAYFIGKDYWKKGIGTTAIKAITSYLINNRGITKIMAEPFERNIGSRKVLKKSGFVFKEIVSNGTVKAGLPINTCRYEYLL